MTMKRIAVTLSDAERAEIVAAMKCEGVRSIAFFLRMSALRLARQSNE